MSAHTDPTTRFRFGAILAAAALFATGAVGLAPAAADESGSPSASPEATTTEDDITTNPDFEAPETVDTYVGQSVQVRKNADAFPNSDAVNFRWVVTQVNAESLNGLDVSMPLPMDEAPGLRSLTGSENMPTEVDGGVLYQFEDVNSNETKRTLNLWPQERNLPVEVTAEFTLDGEKVSAQDIVGEGGLVTATYTIVNNSVETEDVEFENVAGEPDTEEVETSQAFVGISKQFIPQSWAQFDPGNGIYGADGRGNYQTQWITLAFLPFAEDGKASFGWSAVIPEGEGFIPKMVIEVSPLYVPTHQPEEEEQEGPASSNGVPKPNLDPAMSTVQSGVEDVIAGVEGIANTLGKSKDEIKEGLAAAMEQIKGAVEDLCAPELLDCATEEDPLDLNVIIADLQAISANLADAIANLEANGGDATELIARIDEIKADVEKLQGALAAGEVANNAVIGIVCPGEGPAIGDDQEACNEANQTKGQIELADGLLTGILNAFTEIQAQLPGLVGDIQAGTLTKVKATVDGLIVSLQDLQTYLAALKVPLADLSAGFAAIGDAIDAGVDTLGEAQSGAEQIASGKSQISAGLGQASTDVQNYIAEVVALAEATAAEVEETAEEVAAKANTVKAEMAGLKVRMAESPLPYTGGFNTAYAPAGDPAAVQEASIALLPNNEPVEETDGIVHTRELFGAYQFMLDPADNNKPYTPIRIFLAFAFAIGAGFLGIWATKRAKA